MIHANVGEDCEIYSVGFSLGANHLLRYLGNNNQNNGIKAAISISNPFDVLATGIRLKYRVFGLYDMAIAKRLAKPFLEYYGSLILLIEKDLNIKISGKNGRRK